MIKKYFSLKKFFKYFLPIVIISASIPIGFVVFNKSEKKNDSPVQTNHASPSASFIEKADVFPKIQQSLFYKYLEINDGKVYITKKFTSKIIDFVIKNAKIKSGNILFNYHIDQSENKVDFKFIWKKGNEILDKKEYSLKLSISKNN